MLLELNGRFNLLFLGTIELKRNKRKERIYLEF